MNRQDEKHSEFYIGYLPMAPQKTGQFIRRICILIAGLLISIGAFLVLQQGTFSSSAFDYGVPVSLQGQLFQYPVPHLKVAPAAAQGKNNFAQSILLVGFGKAGATPVIQSFMRKSNISGDGIFVNISGNLIYGDGKCLMQVNASEDISLLTDVNNKASEQIEYVGKQGTFEGEIVDPKCYFGVMKPGEGKPHRSCAIRCIAGGIPPVFHSGTEYFILTGENGEPVNEDVLAVVGDQVILNGDVVQMDNWKILKVKKEVLSKITVNRRAMRKLISLNNEMIICK